MKRKDSFNLLKSSFDGYYFILIGAVLIAFTAIYLYSGLNPNAVNHFNSYSIQAESWLNGRLDVYNYRHLEIAIFEGRYFISFPPFPSFIMLPLVLIYGRTTPDHLVALIAALLSTIYAYKLAKLYLNDKRHALFVSLFLVLGTNYLHVALWGAVWYIAQNLAFLFTLMAIYYAATSLSRAGSFKHSSLSLLFLCMAMGCRPLNAIFMPLIFYLLYLRERECSGFALKGFLIRLLKCGIPAVILGVVFMGLNFARFRNIFQFGHDYLPEFLEADYGQFSLNHVGGNLRTIFLGLPQVNDGVVFFPMFGGHAFWIASPIIITFAIYFILRLSKKTNVNEKILYFTVLVSILLHVFALSFHRTLGGHQFGNRYTVDLLPIVFLGLLLVLKTGKRDGLYYHVLLFLPGFIMNLVGTIGFMQFYFG
jgi:hypothetical protein